MTTYQAHARRRERVAIKAAMREVAPEEFGECEHCGFTHSYPLERAVCPVCGGDVCRGEPVCACGGIPSEVSGKLKDAVGAACANTGPHGEYRPPTWRYPHGE